MEVQTELLPKNSIASAKLQDLGIKAAAQEAESTGFMNPGTKVKKKTGRPPGSKTKTKETETIGKVQETQKDTTQPAIPTQKIVGPVVNLISKTTATMLGSPAAMMQATEFNDISESLGMVLEKWMPTISDKYGAELYLGVSLSSWGARLWAIKTLQDEEKEKTQNKKSMELMTEEKLAARKDNFEMPEPQINETPDFLKNLGN